MSGLASWQLKFDRAQRHRMDAEAMVAAATTEQEIRIEKELVGKEWVYTVHHDAVIDPAFPAVLGDFLFNLRSAIDHIAASNRTSPTWKTPFPLFHEPVGGLPTPGEPARLKRYRDIWANVKANTPPAVFDVMDAAQPFNAPNGLVPANMALAVLNELHNRDKHGSLAVVTTGIKDIKCWVLTPDGLRPVRDPNLPPGMFPNGADIFRDERSLEFRVRGEVGLAVAAGPTGGYRFLPTCLEDMSDEVGLLLAAIESVM